MRRLLTWVAGAAGGLAAYKAATRRQVEPQPVPADADPASELRAKLAEARTEEPKPLTLDERRRSVHDDARSAIDEMRGDET